MRNCIPYEEMMERYYKKSEKKSGPPKAKKFSATAMIKANNPKSFNSDGKSPKLTPNQAASLYWLFLGQKYNFIDFNKKSTIKILTTYENNFINRNETDPMKLCKQILYYYRDLRLVSYYNNFGPLLIYKPISYTDEQWENLILKTGGYTDTIMKIYKNSKESLNMDSIEKLLPNLPDSTFKFK